MLIADARVLCGSSTPHYHCSKPLRAASVASEQTFQWYWPDYADRRSNRPMTENEKSCCYILFVQGPMISDY